MLTRKRELTRERYRAEGDKIGGRSELEKKKVRLDNVDYVNITSLYFC